MRLLVVTQVVDRSHPVLGFFHHWLEEFSKHSQSVVVICLNEGEHSLPVTVRVRSLGKESGPSRLKYLWRLAKYLWQERSNYDTVFVHMNSEYLVLAGWWWKLTRKKILFWYTHRQVTWSLRLAEKLADKIFTAAKESFRLPSKKLTIVGHGISLEQYHCAKRRDWRAAGQLLILHVGRITPIKNCDVLLRAVATLNKAGLRTKVIFVGGPAVHKDEIYLADLQRLVTDLGLTPLVTFTGPLVPAAVRDYYCQADLLINLTPPGGIDKVVLEAMAAGLVPLSSNTAFADYFASLADRLIFPERNDQVLAEKIAYLVKEGESINQLSQFLIAQVSARASLDKLISTILLA